jgi:hypothetical protein
MPAAPLIPVLPRPAAAPTAPPPFQPPSAKPISSRISSLTAEEHLAYLDLQKKMQEWIRFLYLCFLQNVCERIV